MQPKRILGLDLLRGIAVLMVMCNHAAPPPDSVIPVFRSMILHIFQMGWSGVDLFFALSGFLVSGLLFSEEIAFGSYSISRFWIRRGMRIYPAFWCLIGVSLVFQFLKSGTLDFSALSAELLFYQNYHWPAIWDHTWTLAVEEHFYLLLPMGLLLVRRGTRTDAKPFRWLPLGCFLLMAGCLLWRISLHLRGFDYRSAAFLTPTQLRIDSLAYGVLLSWLYHFHQGLWQRISRHWLVIVLGSSHWLGAPIYLCH